MVVAEDGASSLAFLISSAVVAVAVVDIVVAVISADIVVAVTAANVPPKSTSGAVLNSRLAIVVGGVVVVVAAAGAVVSAVIVAISAARGAVLGASDADPSEKVVPIAVTDADAFSLISPRSAADGWKRPPGGSALTPLDNSSNGLQSALGALHTINTNTSPIIIYKNKPIQSIQLSFRQH